MGPGQRGGWLQTGAATSRMRRAVRDGAGGQSEEEEVWWPPSLSPGVCHVGWDLWWLAGTPPLVVREWVGGSCVSESLVPAKNSQLQGWNPWLLYV